MKNTELQQELNKLPNELEPSRDLWAGIEVAISKTPQQVPTTYHWVTKVAAAFVPAAIVLGLWMKPSITQQPEATWLQPVTVAFQMQKEQLIKRVSSNTEVSSSWQESLKELEQAELALLKALENQPNDAALMKMLKNVYMQQLDVINRSHTASYTQI